MEALKSGSDAEKVATLRDAGILDAKGELTKTYKNWGTKVTRTPELEIDSES
jgi:hypothetical protein